jgi:succinyl-diaminopimelate desuccinylase
MIDAALRRILHLDLFRDGNAMVALTTLGRPERVVLAGHIDTVPIADNLPARLDGDLLYGCGGCDMKSGVAVQLRLAASLPEPNRDVTYVFYDGEEVEAERNGLLRCPAPPTCWTATWPCCWSRPPSRAAARDHAGRGPRDRRARPRQVLEGTNAIHQAEPILDVLRNYVARNQRSRASGTTKG